MLIEGQRLGDFEILDHIGQGGMGAVFKARQISLERIVALKTLKPFVSDDPEYVARFHQEAVAAASLNHPNLVEVYAAGEAEGIHFFAMEFIDGESALGRLERLEGEGRAGRIEPLEAIAMATHVSVALDHGWRKAGLIHRDIKPDNIFLSTEGEVKLGDLGLAKSGGQSMATQTGAAIGTPHYVSPEQAEGKKDIDLRADIYSLGCTLFHLLSGRPPYAAESSMAVMLKHVSAPVPDLREAWPDCPEELAELVGRMMQKAPADRFQSHAEVGAEMRHVYDCLCGNSVPNAVAVAPDAATRRSGIQPGLAAVPGVPVKKSQVPLYAGIAAGILALAAAAFFVLQPKAESGRAASPKPPGAPGESALPMTAAAAPTPMATGAAPSAAWQPLFTGAAWKQTIPGKREVVDGRVHLLAHSEMSPQPAADGAIRTRIQFREGLKVAALVARMTPDNRKYKLQIDQRSAYLFCFPGGSATPIELVSHARPKPLQPGDTVSLELRLQGDHLTALVDGVVVFDAHDSRASGPGQWGIIADDGWFESVEVQTLPLAAPAVEPWQNLFADQSLMAGVAQAGSTMNGQTLELISQQNVLKRGEYRNGAVRLRAIFEDKRQCSVTVRKHDSQERYVANVTDARSVYLSIVREGKGTLLQSIKLPQPLVAGRAYQLELRIVGSLLSVRFDGALLATQEDSTSPGPGQFGVWNPSDATQAIQGVEFLDLDTPAATPTVQTASLASAATKDAPFVNTLGMKFAPVPIVGGPTAGKTVLFSVWDTRVQDYAVFATETKRGLPKPDFEQGPTHPQVTVNWEDATAFCQWLTERESRSRGTGSLPPGWAYRLPSDHEWSCAVGIGELEDPAKLPIDKAGKIPNVYPWGTQWPPPKGAGNLAGEELSPVVAAGRDVFIKALLPGYNDGFLYTSPVGSFGANRLGLYDMAGNVAQWCEDWYSKSQKIRVTRGSGWSYLKPEEMLSSARGSVVPTLNNRVIGFRCVLEAAPAAGWEDLLAKLTPELVAQTGHGWRLKDGALYSPGQNRGVVPLPGTFAGTSYQARVKLRQLQPKGSFNFVLPVADRMVQFVMEGYPEDGLWSGLDLVNNKETKVLPGALHGKQVRDSEAHELEVTVRLDGANAKITVTLDTRPLYEWAGPTAALSLKSSWATTPPGSFALGTWTDDWVVSEVKAKRLGSTPAAPPAVAAAGWEDLLAKLNPELVAQTGHGWRLEAGALYSPNKRAAMLPMPGSFAGISYQVRLKVRQITAKNSFFLVLPVGDRMTGFELDGWGGKYTGLNMVNGKFAQSLPGIVKGKQVKDSELHELEVIVRLDGANATITTTLDTRPLYEWTGPTAALDRPSEWATSPLGSLAFSTVTDDWVVSEVKVKRLDPALSAASTPASTPTAATPKPETVVEKWFAQVDGPQQEAYQKQAVQPFETGLAEMRTRYLATLDAAIAKASAAGQLDEALAFRTERQAFAEAQNVAADDTGVPPGVLAMRVAFRQQLAKLDQARLAKAKTLFAVYDAILDKDQSLLTQRQRLDEALLLKTKRDGVAGVWLAPSPLISAAGAVAAPEPAKATPPPPAVKDTGIRPAAATKENPFVNALGMKFVPVPITHGPTAGKRILVSIWDTRVQDYQVFADETQRDWPKPGFPLEPTHPAVMVDWDDSKAFCAWLTERERKAGKLTANEEYRLPSDLEWSCAVGLPPEQGETPAEKSGRNQVDFPWGRNFPPKKPLGNYAEQLYADGYVKTSPVGSFPANRFGLYDMGGNVWQWCEDWLDATHTERALRGAAWNQYDRDPVLSSARARSAPTARSEEKGFRCVLSASAR